MNKYHIVSIAKKGLFLGILLIAVLAVRPMGLSADNASTYKSMLDHDRVPGEFVVRLESGTKSLNSMKATFYRDPTLGVQSFKAFETNAALVEVKIADDTKAELFLKTMNSHPGVRYAEPNYTVSLSSLEVLPNDPNFNLLWGLKNTGQTIRGNRGEQGADISATEAWAIERGSKDVLVAVIDSGVDYTHPDLKDNIALNQGEMGFGTDGQDKSTNGIDDDGNGFIDDWRGWNFAVPGGGTNDPMDDNRHGTHVAGTIGAFGDNDIGITGVAWEVGIVPIKFLSAFGFGTIASATKAVQYATTRGVDIMNNSWGGGGFSQALLEAIEEAKSAGILFVAAAGNSRRNNDVRPSYPASYEVDNIISVAATNNRDRLASFSNYGKRTVHIAAPGEDIYSTLLNGGYGMLSGTSMAAPHVSGAAALILSSYTEEDYTKVRERILESSDRKQTLASKIMSSGRLNVYEALRYSADVDPPDEEDPPLCLPPYYYYNGRCFLLPSEWW